MSKGDFLGLLSQQILVGIISVGKLGVAKQCLDSFLVPPRLGGIAVAVEYVTSKAVIPTRIHVGSACSCTLVKNCWEALDLYPNRLALTQP